MLLVLLVTLSGCIVTYRDFPIVDPLPSVYEPTATPRCQQTVFFPGGHKDEWELRYRTALQEALQTYGGCSSSSLVDYNSKWAETEVVVSALGKYCPGYYGFIALSSIVSGGFIPYYCGQDGWAVSYSVYHRNALKKTYTYEITRKVFV